MIAFPPEVCDSRCISQISRGHRMQTPARTSDADLNEGNLFAYIRTFSAHAGCELF